MMHYWGHKGSPKSNGVSRYWAPRERGRLLCRESERRWGGEWFALLRELLLKGWG